jgi:transcriptional regulator with XRE-family HTH domain
MVAKLNFYDPLPAFLKELRERQPRFGERFSRDDIAKFGDVIKIYEALYTPAFLKELRERTGMTQPRLGELAGFSRDDIANFERGFSHLSVGDAVKIYEALATADRSGDAISAALLAAASLTKSRMNTLESAKRELEEKKKYVKAARRWLQEARADEKRLRALKGKRTVTRNAEEGAD